jgi:cytochrome P450 family 9
VTDPKLVKKLAVKDFDYFVDHRSFISEDVDKLFGKSIVNMKGQRWRGI